MSSILQTVSLILSWTLLSLFLIHSMAAPFGPDAIANLGVKRTCLPSTSESYDVQRCFYTYIPECAGENAPLVFDIHGYGSAPQYNTIYTGWISKADENCFVVVMPSGNIEPPATSDDDNACFAMPGGLTNTNGTEALPCCCFSATGIVDATLTDDTTFLRNVAVSVIQDVIPEETSNTVSIDSTRIYMAGHSNGCISSLAMAAVQSDLVAAVCCHAGVAQASFPDSYQPTPIWVVHGTLDFALAYDGLEKASIFGFPQYSMLGASETHDVFASANGCNISTSEIIEIETPDNTVTQYISSDCVNNATVELMTLKDVGHNPYLDFLYIENGTVPIKVDTTQLAWDFCSQHSLDTEPELILVTPPDNKSDASILVGFSSHVSGRMFGLIIVGLWWLLG